VNISSLPPRLAAGLVIAVLVITGAAAQERPTPLLHVAANGEPETVLLVEKNTQTMYVYECSGFDVQLVRTLPCTTGKRAGDKQVEGDLKTPEGVYWFRSYRPDESLPPLYGAGALTMDYPNDFDRHAGKTGSGIWMHGVETNARVEIARDTRGCVALRNDHFQELLPRVALGRTPIVVVKDVELAAHEDLAREANELRLLLEDWRTAWEGKDLRRYLSHYHEDFRAPGHRGRSSWARHKTQLAQRYAGMRIGIDDVTMLRERDRIWLTFRQEYASGGHRDVGLKTLTLLADGGRPRILSERWRPLDEDFLLIDPGEIDSMSPTLIASLAPDAAADGAPPVEPELVLARAEPPPATPVVEAAPQPAPEPEPAPAPEPEPAAPEAPATPAPDLRPRTLDALLAADGSGRDVYRLLAPYARLTPVGVRLEVQLLNKRPSRQREGVLSWRARMPGLETVTQQPERRALVMRQGELLRIDLPQPVEPGDLLVEILVEGATGRPALSQTIRIPIASEESRP
jgi:murein L,D-transpeptidase YafK